jgi:hypothetical protein
VFAPLFPVLRTNSGITNHQSLSETSMTNAGRARALATPGLNWTLEAGWGTRCNSSPSHSPSQQAGTEKHDCHSNPAAWFCPTPCLSHSTAYTSAEGPVTLSQMPSRYQAAHKSAASRPGAVTDQRTEREETSKGSGERAQVRTNSVQLLPSTIHVVEPFILRRSS